MNNNTAAIMNSWPYNKDEEALRRHFPEASKEFIQQYLNVKRENADLRLLVKSLRDKLDFLQRDSIKIAP